MNNPYFPIDTHTHSIASGHAYSTIAEMSVEASKKGIRVLSITEHGPATMGSCVKYYFQNLRILPRLMNGVNMLFGAEVSILDNSGKLDLDDEVLKQLDIAIASIHNGTSFSPQLIDYNTQAVIGALNNPNVCILGHPDDARYPLNYEEIVRTAGEKNVLIEINNSSLDLNGWRENAYENCLTILRLCRKMGIQISLASDAHYAGDVGNFTRILPLLEETKFPLELVANRSEEYFLGWLKGKKNTKGSCKTL